MAWLLFIVLFVVILSSVVFYTMRYGISPMPSLRKSRRLICAEVVGYKGTIFELGSGWGHLAFDLARGSPQACVMAYEVSFFPWLVSRCWLVITRLSNVKIKKQDFFDVSLSEANLVVCYLYPGAMSRLKEKFERELVPGTFVISHTFAVPGWVPKKTLRVNDLYQTPIYFYEFAS